MGVIPREWPNDFPAYMEATGNMQNMRKGIARAAATSMSRTSSYMRIRRHFRALRLFERNPVSANYRWTFQHHSLAEMSNMPGYQNTPSPCTTGCLITDLYAITGTQPNFSETLSVTIVNNTAGGQDGSVAFNPSTHNLNTYYSGPGFTVYPGSTTGTVQEYARGLPRGVWLGPSRIDEHTHVRWQCTSLSLPRDRNGQPVQLRRWQCGNNSGVAAFSRWLNHRYRRCP